MFGETQPGTSTRKWSGHPRKFLLEQTVLQNVPGILLQLDFRKAFDTVELPVIRQVLSRFNFGDSIKRWVETFYCNAESSIFNNGFTTKQILLKRGVRQGCPLSPYLYILLAEVLAAKMRQDKSVQGVKLFKKEIKLSQFADDTSLICNSLTSVENALAILDEFSIISGLRLNKSKTKAVWLGPWRSYHDKPLGLAWTNEPVKVSGTYISYDSISNEEKNVARKINNLETKLAAWKSVNYPFSVGVNYKSARSSETISFQNRVLHWFNEMHDTTISLANWEL